MHVVINAFGWEGRQVVFYVFFTVENTHWDHEVVSDQITSIPL